MPPSNTAAWLMKPKEPLAVASAPYTPPGPNQVVVRSRAIGVNYCDWAKQDLGSWIFPWAKLPFVMGEDVAGEVVEVGTGAGASFKVGDRVLGHALGLDKISAGASEGAFQEYVVLNARLVARIPDSVTFERACVLPVCLSTAATGLFCDKHLGLNLPSVDSYAATDSKKAGKVLVVWGASTAVGMNCVQLAVGAGYTVVATAGKHNFDYVRGCRGLRLPPGKLRPRGHQGHPEDWVGMCRSRCHRGRFDQAMHRHRRSMLQGARQGLCRSDVSQRASTTSAGSSEPDDLAGWGSLCVDLDSGEEESQGSQGRVHLGI